jgi:glycosyltransferase involved in cell wall biosynthesis
MPHNKKNNLSKLKIVFVADAVDGEKSGGVISARRLISFLEKKHNLTVISTGKKEANKIVLPQFYLPFAKKQMTEMGFLFAWPNRKILESAIREADIVHIQFPFLLGYKALTIARELGKPIILGFHVQPENLMWNIGLKFDWLNACLYHFFVKSFYNRGDRILSPSDMGKIMLEKYGIKIPVKVISNGLPPQFKPGNYPPDSRFKGKFIVLMVGRLAKEKRHDLVMQAIKLSSHKDQIQLVVTGQGPLREELEALGNELPNPAIFGYVSQPELIKLFNTAHLFIHASEIELEGMAVMEAIGCGLPALIADSSYSASPQFALNEKFLFKVGDAKNLSSKIDYWIKHRDELNTAKQAYLAKAQEYSFDICAKKTKKLYYEAINQSTR